MLDYKMIIIKSCGLYLSSREIAEQLQCSKSGVNDFLKEFRECDALDYPLPEGITNYAIAEIVYGTPPGHPPRDSGKMMPDYKDVHRQLTNRSNMTLVYLWNRYRKQCENDGQVAYSYRQFCDLYSDWCEENEEDAHFIHVIGQNMEVDFAGQTFQLIDPLTEEISKIVVFVAVLPYSQKTYAEGMASTKEPQWIQVNNHALAYFGRVTPLVTCDNCKQAVLANEDWI